MITLTYNNEIRESNKNQCKQFTKYVAIHLNKLSCHRQLKMVHKKSENYIASHCGKMCFVSILKKLQLNRSLTGVGV